jgi:hypothetical protein
VKKFIWAVIIVGVMITLAQKMKGAVVATDLSLASYNEILSTSTQSFQGKLSTGFSSSGTPEMSLTTDVTILADHTWSVPEQIALIYDFTGNLTLRAGSTLLVDQPLLGFNAVLIQLKDSAPLNFQTEIRDITVNGVSIRNLLAKRTTQPTDQLMITGFGSEIDIEASFYKNPASSGETSLLTFTGVVIPEPSTLIFSIGFLLLLRRQRKN